LKSEGLGKQSSRSVIEHFSFIAAGVLPNVVFDRQEII
jgi:hypothetical protein